MDLSVKATHTMTTRKDAEVELFNATGSKLYLLKDFMENVERKRILKEPVDARTKTQLKLINLESSMTEKKKGILRRHLLDSSIAIPNKMSIIGDELNLRESINASINSVNFRDGVVST